MTALKLRWSALAGISVIVALAAACMPTDDPVVTAHPPSWGRRTQGRTNRFPTDPVPPTSIAAAAGDRLWSSEELVGSSPEVRMVVSPNKGDIEYISDVVSLAWEQLVL